MRAALTFALVTLSCCATAVPAMHDGTAAALSGHSRVVFVRPSSACDGVGHARIVDLEGHFVGALGPGTWFQAPLDNEKVFAVWSSVDRRNAKVPEFHPVDVIRLAPSPGGTTFAPVRLPGGAAGRRCGSSIFYFARQADSQSEAWMRDARELVPDPAAGQALLDEDPDVTRAYLEMAREKDSR